MRNYRKNYRIYSVRRVPSRTIRNLIAVLSLLVCAVVFSVFVVSCNKLPEEIVSSSLASSKIETSSMLLKDASSEVALPETSSMPTGSSSKVQVVISSQTQEITSSQTQSASVNTTTPATNSSLLYDISSVADNWTYVVDKSNPVPLQPRVDNSFFSSAMFVGDSITTGIDLYSIIKGSPVVAYTGINTNTVLSRKVIKTSQGKITFLQQMAKYNPKHIYIMMGINGIAFQSKANLISGYSQFVDKVKKQHPNAIIYLQSILPVTAKKQSKDSRFANSKINDYNAAIANLAKQKGVYYLNVAEAFKDGNGNLPAAASSDGIHFGPAYYKRWIEYLKTHTVYTGETPKDPVINPTSSSDIVSGEISSNSSSSSDIVSSEISSNTPLTSDNVSNKSSSSANLSSDVASSKSSSNFPSSSEILSDDASSVVTSSKPTSSKHDSSNSSVSIQPASSSLDMSNSSIPITRPGFPPKRPSLSSSNVSNP